METYIDKWFNSIKDTNSYIEDCNEFNKIICKFYYIANEYEYKMMKALCIKEKDLLKKNIIDIFFNFKNEIEKLELTHVFFDIKLTNQDKLMANVIRNKFEVIQSTYIYYYKENTDIYDWKLKNI